MLKGEATEKKETRAFILSDLRKRIKDLERELENAEVVEVGEFGDFPPFTDYQHIKNFTMVKDEKSWKLPKTGTLEEKGKRTVINWKN